jgi:hypothetical protein
MKNIVSKINEGKYCHLFSEVQNDITKMGEYHTYDYTDGEKKYKRGFLYFNDDQGFFGIEAFNSADEFADMLGVEVKEYKQLDSIEIGETVEIEKSKIMRIW